MSLWFSSPAPANSSPADSRQVGFGQVKALGPSFTAGGSEETSPMSSAAGGITQNFASRTSISSNINNDFNFDGPNFYNNSMSYQNTINNNIMQNFAINNLFQLVEQMTNVLGGGGSATCAETIDVVTGVSLTGSGLVFTRSTVGVCTKTSIANTTISTNTCT